MTATAPAAPAKVYFTNLRAHARESQLDKLKRLIRRAGIEQIDFENKFVAIKIHFGELGNLSFLRRLVKYTFAGAAGAVAVIDLSPRSIWRYRHKRMVPVEVGSKSSATPSR